MVMGFSLKMVLNHFGVYAGWKEEFSSPLQEGGAMKEA
jgi:hypothetical protein